MNRIIYCKIDYEKEILFGIETINFQREKFQQNYFLCCALHSWSLLLSFLNSLNQYFQSTLNLFFHTISLVHDDRVTEVFVWIEGRPCLLLSSCWYRGFPLWPVSLAEGGYNVSILGRLYFLEFFILDIDILYTIFLPTCILQVQTSCLGSFLMILWWLIPMSKMIFLLPSHYFSQLIFLLRQGFVEVAGGAVLEAECGAVVTDRFL